MTDQKRGNLIKQSDDTYRRVDAEPHGAVQDDGYSNPAFGGAHVDLGDRVFPTVMGGRPLYEQAYQR
jgi:hypothetical protein